MHISQTDNQPPAVCLDALTNILFINESMAVQFFWDLSYGMSHGFHITLDLSLMAWNFKFFFFS